MSDKTQIARERHKNCYGVMYRNMLEENITIDASEPDGYLSHAWEECICSGTPWLYLTPEKNYARQILQHLEDVHKTLGFKRVYFDKIVANEPHITTYTEDENGKPVYDWSQADKVYEKILKIGIKPFVMIAAVPNSIASDPGNTNFDGANSSAPRDYKKWKEFCKAFVKHLIQRYGEDEVVSWYFQILNEPDIVQLYWSGTHEEWFMAYDYAATGIKEVDARIKVGPGGFATTYGPLIAQFVDHVTSFNYDPEGDPAGAPVDFINSHAYILPRGLSMRGDFDKLERYMTSYFGPDHGKALIMSEWNTDAGAEPSPTHDGEMNAAFVVRQVAECAKDFFNDPRKVRFFAFWCHSDVYDELGEIDSEFSGLFGLITPNGIRKPNFNAFRMLHALGTSRIRITGGNEEVNGIATRNNDRITILLYNCKYDILRNDGDESLRRLVHLNVKNIPWSEVKIEHYRIDHDHSNSYTEWKNMGRPAVCSDEQLECLKKASEPELLQEPLVVQTHDGIFRDKFELPMPGVSMLVITPVDKEFVFNGRKF